MLALGAGGGSATRVRSPRPQAGTREPLTTLPRSARSRVSWSLAETRLCRPPSHSQLKFVRRKTSDTGAVARRATLGIPVVSGGQASLFAQAGQQRRARTKG